MDCKQTILDILSKKRDVLVAQLNYYQRKHGIDGKYIQDHEDRIDQLNKMIRWVETREE